MLTRSMTIVLLGCSVIIMTESFSPLFMSPMIRGEWNFSRTGPSTACRATSPDADLSPDPITDTNTATAALRHAHQTSCEQGNHSKRRGPTLSISNSSPFRQGASLHSSSELNFRAGTHEPVYFTESGIMASAVGHYDYHPHYYCSSIRDYDEEGDIDESYDEEEGRQRVLGSSITSSSVLMSSLQRSRGQQGYEFRRVDVRASRKECQGKWLQRSAAPIVDLLGLAAPLLLVASFTMGSGNVP